MGEVPLLKQLYAKYGEQGAVFLGVSLDESLEALDRMVAHKAIPWPQLADGKKEQGEVPQAFRVTGYPFFYLLDRTGRIAARLDSAGQLEDQLTEVLAASEATPRREPRDSWQRPMKVMDWLGVREGSVVADVGSGEGYFTFRLAARVGSSGRVFAVDIDEAALGRLRDRAEKEGRDRIHVVRGKGNDPKLAAESVDVVLIADSYHEFKDPDAMLRGIVRALKAGGRLGILDRSDSLGQARTKYQQNHTLPQEMLIEDAARHGLRLLKFEPDFAGPPGSKPFYFAIFEKPKQH